MCIRDRIIAGSTIATVKLLPALKKPRLYYTCFVKLFLLPALLKMCIRDSSEFEKDQVTVR